MQVLLSPLHINEVLLRWHEEIEGPLNKLGFLHHFFKSLRGEQIPFKNFIDNRPNTS